MANFHHPRGRGIRTVEQSAPHVQLWNPQLDLTWSGDELQTITETAEDGTDIRITLTWTAGKITSITRWAEVP
tara:strand:- start:11498 stop:11716 length:219 start_codon:yes stop_codon:yes gene_type:complete